MQHTYNHIQTHVKHLRICILLLITCIFNYFIQQIFMPFLLPINIILIIYLILNNFNINILYIIIGALLDEQLLGYHFGSLVTLYSLICFIILNNTKYPKFTFLLSLSLWLFVNYNTSNIIKVFGL